jgi:diguanylate cyclase (GGDEF)-like protein
MNGTWLEPRYDTLTVVASVFIAIYASYVALDLAKRVVGSDRTVARGWLLGGSVAMGTGIWAMHFVGMLAYRLPIDIGYDPQRTFVSWAAAVAVSLVALGVATRRKLTVVRLVAGSLAMGAGICAMHYLGMAAMVMQPGIVWDLGLVAASGAIAVGASAVALMIFFWLRRRTQVAAGVWQMVAAVVMGLAIAGMHYTGMAAAHVAQGSVCLSAQGLRGAELATVVVMVAVVLLTITLLVSILDARLQSKTSRLAHSLQAANDKLLRMAFEDPLTGLPNRLMFEERLSHLATQAGRQVRRAAVLFIDLDGFKPINDLWGHHTGDEVLRRIAGRLQELTRAADTVARVGGDEFVMLIEDMPDNEAAAQVAERIIEAISQPVRLGEREATVSCSIGISVHPDDGQGHKLLGQADAAMYTAKRAGRGCYRFFEPRMDAGVHEQVEMHRDLRIAIAQGQLRLLYQPKVHGGSGQITGVEALVRWEHPRRGVLSPALFIPVAERFGLIGALGHWVISEACRQIQAWAREGLRMRVAINLSAHQLQQDDLADRIEEALRSHGVEPSQLTFELTESAAMEDAELTLRTFERLAAIGITLSIDDFGTGYSSLSYLSRLPTQQLKIDRCFVQELETSADARAIVDAVVRLAHALGRQVVAEGVETEAQCRLLQALGCDELQGFLFAKPMAPDRLSLWALGGTETRSPDFRASIYDATLDAPAR